jgi:phenol 2-monooxygenase
MQFHLNGFRPGDPEILEPYEQHAGRPDTDSLPNEVDVLIVGCGPAGLTLAAQLAAFPDIRTRIVEQKSGPLMRARRTALLAAPWKCSRLSDSASGC